MTEKDPTAKGVQRPQSYEPQNGVQLGDELTHGTRMMEGHSSTYVKGNAVGVVVDQDTEIFHNTNHRGAHFVIDVGVNSGLPAAVFSLFGLYFLQGDATETNSTPTNKEYLLLETPPISVDTIMVMKLYPGIDPLVNARANDVLPRAWFWRVNTAAGTIDYNISANLLY